MRAVVWCFVALLGSGCSGFLQEGADSRLAFLCAALDGEGGGPMTLLVHGADHPVAVARLADSLAGLSGRKEVPVRFDDSAPPDPMDDEQVQRWVDDRRFDQGRGIRLRVVWVDALPARESGALWAPGIVAVARDAVASGVVGPAQAEDVAAGILAHHAGHALGLVNDGAPLAEADGPAGEGPPKHRQDKLSIMHVAWHGHGPYPMLPPPGYDARDRADLDAARAGPCTV